MAEINKKVFDVFGSIFLLSQKLQYINDHELGKLGLTTKQFLVLGAVDTAFENPPTLNEVAMVLSTSRQNVKQLANQLEKKGFMELVSDPSDKRKVLLKTTEKNHAFWESHTEETMVFFRRLFGELTNDEVEELYLLLNKLMASFDKFYYEIRS
ncbi:MAG: MarR family transcriptional regulator [Candidatus Bathyarchaeota archaeon]|nr:MarR family transcriptional regulator [Candidatus Bathyarchaeota archaeon]